MGYPMIDCAICGATVTKRSSLLVEPFGRICRTHPEVERQREKAREAAEEQKLTQAAEDNLNVIMAVSCVRAMAAINRIPVSLGLGRIMTKLPARLLPSIKKELEDRGALTEDEVVASLAAMTAPARAGAA